MILCAPHWHEGGAQRAAGRAAKKPTPTINALLVEACVGRQAFCEVRGKNGVSGYKLMVGLGE